LREPNTSLRDADASRTGFLPDFCTLRAAFVVAITAELFAMILAMAAAESLDRFWDVLSERSLIVQWICLATALLLCTLRPVFARLGTLAGGVLAWCLLMLVALAVAGVSLHAWPGGALLGGASAADQGRVLLQVLGISAIAGALVLRYLYVQHQWRRQVEAESRARFQALQSRIRPHFLFNSMNTIAALARTDPGRAEEAVSDLADLFRASLRETGGLSTLAEELDLARGYLRIEQQRMGERLRVEWDLEGLPEKAPLPPLVIQPLLENAVYHGIERLSDPGVIRISGRYRHGKVRLSVCNPAPPPDAPRRAAGHRLAIDNIRERLAGAFGDSADLTSTESEGEYRVHLVFPYAGSRSTPAYRSG
jgi:two-component system sensor histidine kinase AlgZ